MKKEEPVHIPKGHEVLKQGNISLILDNYDDIFSDFDPRPYSEKALSDDFLAECRKATHDKTDDGLGLELRFLVPKRKRDTVSENHIKNRLKNHFQKHYIEKQKEMKGLQKGGLLWFIFGGILIFIATLLYNYKGLIYNFLIVVLEPAGWFTMWSGLDRMFIYRSQKQPDLDFYKKMSNARIYFFSY